LHLAFPNRLQKRQGVRNVAEGVESRSRKSCSTPKPIARAECLPEIKRAADRRMPDDAIKIRANR
jgi:hypothetical protein